MAYKMKVTFNSSNQKLEPASNRPLTSHGEGQRAERSLNEREASSLKTKRRKNFIMS